MFKSERPSEPTIRLLKPIPKEQNAKAGKDYK